MRVFRFPAIVILITVLVLSASSCEKDKEEEGAPRNVFTLNGKEMTIDRILYYVNDAAKTTKLSVISNANQNHDKIMFTVEAPYNKNGIKWTTATGYKFTLYTPGQDYKKPSVSFDERIQDGAYTFIIGSNDYGEVNLTLSFSALDALTSVRKNHSMKISYNGTMEYASHTPSYP